MSVLSLLIAIADFFGDPFEDEYHEDEYHKQYVIHDEYLSWSDALAAC